MLSEEEIRKETVLTLVKQMAIAARTAPKARGVDLLEIKIIHETKEILTIADEMKKMGEDNNLAFFLRDSENIKKSVALLLIGTSISPLGLMNCNYCGMQNCENKNKYPTVPCVFNTNDLGIAIGSAVSVAADSRLDTRVMFSLGRAVKNLSIFPENISVILGIAVSVSGKNIFFDRK